MRILPLALVVYSTVTVGTAANAANFPNANITVQCSGKSGAQVALRWGSPNYDSDPTKYMPMFTVPCVLPGQPMGVHPHVPFPVKNPKSVFEVQTKGGIETSYVINVTIGSQQSGRNNFIILDHSGSPSTMFTGTGFTLTQSSGPNKYGEQNKRVQLTSATSANVHILAQSSGDRSDAQVAMRWGHPDFNDHGLIGIFTVKAAGPPQTKDFVLPAQKSEFEIQTEGGEGTGYHISIWINQPTTAQPSIEIVHQKPNTDVTTGTTDMTFDTSPGNIYGEMDVTVHAPWIVPVTAPAPSLGGLNIVYAFTFPPATGLTTALVQYQGSTKATTTNSTARTTFSKQVTESVNNGIQNLYADDEANLQPGTWTITAGQLIDGKLTGSQTCTVNIAAGTAPTVTADGTARMCQP